MFEHHDHTHLVEGHSLKRHHSAALNQDFHSAATFGHHDHTHSVPPSVDWLSMFEHHDHTHLVEGHSLKRHHSAALNQDFHSAATFGHHDHTHLVEGCL
jgi:hypothetical protein